MKLLFWTTIVFSCVFINGNMEATKSNVKRILVRRIRKLPHTTDLSNTSDQKIGSSAKKKTLTKDIDDISTNNNNYTIAMKNLKKSVEMLSSLYNQRRVEKVLDEGASSL